MLCAEGANFLKNCPVKVKIIAGKGLKKFDPKDSGGGGARATRAPRVRPWGLCHIPRKFGDDWTLSLPVNLKIKYTP